MGKVNRLERDQNPVNKTIEKRQQKDREALIEQFRKTPIVQLACEKTGVGRATYYRWRNENPTFAKEADEALQESVSLMNDLAESQLLSAIRDKNMTAIIFWLKHRHKAYTSRLELSGELNHRSIELTDEQKELISRALRLASPAQTIYE